MSSCPAAGDPTCQHHRPADYFRGCRCKAACDARTRYVKTRHLLPPGLVPAIGTHRRLRALMAIGWRDRDLAARLGRTTKLGPLLYGDLVTRRTHDSVRDLYEELWDTPGPSERNRKIALGKGWPPPLWWDDELIDDPNYTPDYQPATVKDQVAPRRETRAIRIARVHKLTRLGWSARRIADELGIHPRQVQRDRAVVSPSVETVEAWEVAS